jgi:hypothetical protein
MDMLETYHGVGGGSADGRAAMGWPEVEKKTLY